MRRDQGGRSLEGEVWGGEGKVGEKWDRLFVLALVVFVEKLEHSIDDRFGDVDRLVVKKRSLGKKVVVVVFDAEGTIETRIASRAVDVPFPALVALVASGSQVAWDEAGPGGAATLAGGALVLGKRVAAYLLRVVAAEQRGACGPAAGRVVGIGPANACSGQSIECGGRYFPSVAAQIGEA